MIYDQLFGDDDDTLSNVVEVHVSHIRKKFGKDFIQTRRGQGYQVDGSGSRRCLGRCAGGFRPGTH